MRTWYHYYASVKLTLLLCLLGYSVARGQGTIPIGEDGFDFWAKYSPELILRFKRHRYEIRYRPMEMVYPLQGVRQDLMLGYRLKDVPLRVYNYAKFDTRGRLWNGVRIDYTPKFAEFGKAMLQGRYFQGLVEKARHQVYGLQLAMYPLDMPYAHWYKREPKWYAGVFGFSRLQFKEGTRPDFFWFVGPMIYWLPDEVWGVLTALTYDVVGPNELFFLLRLQLRLTWVGAEE